MTSDNAKVKRAWITPQVVVYGSLEELTKGRLAPGKQLGTGDALSTTDLAPLS